MQNKNYLAGALVMLGLAVAIGAFGAHKLAEVLSPKYLATFETGVKYQFYSALGLALLALAMEKYPGLKLQWWLVFAGSCIFSISLYILSLNQVLGESLRLMGAVAPIGGSLLVLGWIWAGIKIWQSKAKQ